MPGRVALPTRATGNQDTPNYVPKVSEYSGTVAAPSRRVLVWRMPDGSTTVVPQATVGVPGASAELVPPPIPEAPSPIPWQGGDYGVVEQPTRRFMFSRDNPWKVTAMNWAADQIAWLRRDYPNTYGQTRFVPGVQATTDWTKNRPDQASPEGDPIPYSNKRQVWTLSREYDDTIWATYRPPPDIQKPANMRAYLATQGYTQLPPYFPRLTQYQTPRSFGQQTQQLPPYPYGTGSRPRNVRQPIYPTQSGYPNPVSSGMFGQ